MALSDRPDIELNEFQREKTGYELDIRYQRLVEILEASELGLLQAIQPKLVALIAGFGSGS